MCFWIFKKRNEYEKNTKKYIEKKFVFLLERGYKYHYFFCNGEETFSFRNDNILFEIYHDIYPFAFDIVLLDGAASFAEIRSKIITFFIGFLCYFNYIILNNFVNKRN